MIIERRYEQAPHLIIYRAQVGAAHALTVEAFQDDDRQGNIQALIAQRLADELRRTAANLDAGEVEYIDMPTFDHFIDTMGAR